MSMIGPVTQDAAIAPRTGSGSPQSQPQQRADAVPAVVSDNPAAKADPGVMLRVIPPAQERSNSLAVGARDRQVAEGLIGTILADAVVDEDAIKQMLFSGKRADDEFLARMSAWLASLPEATQDAIRLAKTPETARLLKIAALTEPSLKTAPAVILTDGQPLAETIDDAAKQLLVVLRNAPPFRAAEFLSNLSRQAVVGASALADPLLAQHSDTRTGESQPLQSETGSLVTRQAALSAGVEETETGNSQSIVNQLKRDQNSELRTSGFGSIGRSELVSDGSDGFAPPVNADKTGTSTGSNVAHTHNAAASFGVASNETFERAVSDAMKLVMDGRLIWQGQLMAGVDARVERSDAWQANRRAAGGMEKGTSIRINLDLPTLGPIEIRASAFPGHIAARVVTDLYAANTFVEGMPRLQQSLRDQGLNGINVTIETR